jgi:hypothetical protein
MTLLCAQQIVLSVDGAGVDQLRFANGSSPGAGEGFRQLFSFGKHARYREFLALSDE